MGIEIDRERFDDADYARFTERLDHCLEALEQLLERPGFGEGPRTIGAELELFLIDDQGHPLTRNQAILEDAGDPRLTLELDRFNLEVNPSPSPLAGQPLTSLGHELEGALESVRATARSHGGRVAMVGILPTLRDEDLHRGAITDAPATGRSTGACPGSRPSRSRSRSGPRRRAAAGGARQHRHGGGQHLLPGPPAGRPRRLRGPLQRRPAGHRPGAGRRRQLAAVPGPGAVGGDPHRPVRAGGRRPRHPGRERMVSRVAFGTDWLRTSILDLFEESVRHHEPLLPICGDQDPLLALGDGGVPRLDELRLHQGTVWRWNRAIYDSGFGGHVRIEMRPCRPGRPWSTCWPTPPSCSGSPWPWPRRRGLEQAAAVRQGPRQLLRRGPPRPGGRAGVADRRRLRAGRGGRAGDAAAARGPPRAGRRRRRRRRGRPAARGARRPGRRRPDRRRLAAAHPGRPGGRRGREEALSELLERYLELQAWGDPVHTWPVEG